MLKRMMVLTVFALCVMAGGGGALGQTEPTEPDSESAKDADELLAEAREAAVEQVLASSRSDDPYLRANAIEASRYLEEERARPMLQLALEDEHPAVRFAALVTIGRLELEEMSSAAKRLTTEDRSASVRAAARYATNAVGEEVDLSPLSTMLASAEPGVRSNVAILLAEMGDPSAVPMLKESAGHPMPRAGEATQALTRIQFAEAMATLGDTASLDAVRAGAYSHLGEVRVVAIQAMGKLQDRRMIDALRHIVEVGGKRRPPIEVRLAAAEALARMKAADDAALSTLLEGAGMDKTPVRAQAALALGQMTQRQAAVRLLELLDDNHEQVRLAAAGGVLLSLEQKRDE